MAVLVLIPMLPLLHKFQQSGFRIAFRNTISWRCSPQIAMCWERGCLASKQASVVLVGPGTM